MTCPLERRTISLRELSHLTLDRERESGLGIGYHSSIYRVDNGDSLVALTNGNSPRPGIANSADEILVSAVGVLNR